MKKAQLWISIFFSALLISFSSAQSSHVTRLPYDDTGALLNFIKPYLPYNPVIVEAGGFDGRDSRHLSKFWPKGQIYTFEPVPELFQKIKKISQKYHNIHPFQLALSDSDGEATFYLSELDWDPGHVSASSSLLAPKEHLTGAPFVSFPNQMQVTTRALDSWAKEEGLDHIDFLWLDMQGSELNMIQASELAQNARAIWMEVEFIEAYEGQYLFSDILTWMEANNFRLAATNFTLTQPENWFADALFLKN